jgi:hypothetical protein
MLAAMIPIVYSLSVGRVMFVPFDEHQRLEILLTVSQSLLGMLLLSNMSFHILEAAGIFSLWLAQFIRPDLHVPVTIVYLGWSTVEIAVTLTVRRRVAAVTAFVALWRGRARGLS